VRGPRRRLGRLSWARRLASCRACSAGRVRTRGACARGRGPGHDGQCVVHAVTAYGRRAMWVQRGRPRGANGATSRAKRAPAFQHVFVLLKPPLTDSNSKTLN
jgi:hypothetical protein